MAKKLKIERDLENYGIDRFCHEAELLLAKRPRLKVVLGINGNGVCYRDYSRPAARYERGTGYQGVRNHSGNYTTIRIRP